MRKNSRKSSSWAHIPLIATVARLLCRELTLQNEYLRQENKIPRSKIKGRIRLDDTERRSLVDAALAMGRKLMQQVVTIVKPETTLAWQRRLEREKAWGYGRIRGELARLGVAVSESCVADILRRNGLPPSPTPA